MTRLAACIALAVFGCTTTNPVAPDPVELLDQAARLWLAQGLDDYEYEIRADCFCVPEVRQWVRVRVQNDTVVLVVPVPGEGSYPVTSWSSWNTIDEVFFRLRTALVNNASHEVYRSIQATYDDVLGYPRSVEYLARPGIADADLTYSIRNLRSYTGIR